MGIEQEPFRAYNIDRKKDTFTVRVNEEERLILEKAKTILGETQDSTAMKDCFILGFNVLHDSKTKAILALIFKKQRLNKLIDIDQLTKL